MGRIQEIEKALCVATDVAKEAGKILRENWGGKFLVEKKGEIDLVTEIDRKVEDMIKETLLKEFPNHGILAEESGKTEQAKKNTNEFLWIVDPLDGTTNFAHGYPSFCTSIGLEVDGELTLGVIYEPLRDELFHAVSGKGAFLNNEPIQVSQTKELDNSLLITGFAYDVRENKKNNLKQFEHFILRAQGVRRDGSAALDFAFVSCGRLDGFWEFNLKPWDMAAGVLMVQEAGGKVSRLDGSPFGLYGNNSLANNGWIHEAMIDVLKGC